jgi:hypothetical protein
VRGWRAAVANSAVAKGATVTAFNEGEALQRRPPQTKMTYRQKRVENAINMETYY